MKLAARGSVALTLLATAAACVDGSALDPGAAPRRNTPIDVPTAEEASGEAGVVPPSPDGSSSTDGGTDSSVDAPPAVPGFSVEVASTADVVQGGSFQILVTVTRTGGLTAPIDVSLDSPPAGFTATPFTIAPGETSGSLAIATSSSVVPGTSTAVTVRATAGDLSTDKSVGVAIHGPSGQLDTTFGDAGLTGVPNVAPYGTIQAALTPDGKIVTATTLSNGTDWDMVVTRFSSDGSVDTTFGVDGTAKIDFGGYDFANALAVQPDGKIVVVGQSSSVWAVARLDTTGALDTTFDGDGKVLTTTFSAYGYPYGLTVTPAGKIVVVGWSQGSIVVRYESDGSLDTTFNASGGVLTDFPGSDSLQAVHVGASGITVAGIANNDFLVARYTDDGALDTTFNGTGSRTVDFGTGGDWATSVAVAAQGAIVALGTATVPGNIAKIGVTRLTSTGELDTTFATTGFTTIGGPNGDQGYALALQYDGKILGAGAGLTPNGSDFYTFRLLTDGTLDPSFNGTGKTYVDLGTTADAVRALLPTTDGRFYAVGRAGAPVNGIAIARYWP